MQIGRVIGAVLGVLGAAMGLAACGSSPQEEFLVENTDSFMAACTQVPNDPLMHTEICQCVIDRAQVVLSYPEFESFEAALLVEPEQGQAEPELDPEMLDLIAECVIKVARL